MSLWNSRNRAIFSICLICCVCQFHMTGVTLDLALDELRPMEFSNARILQFLVMPTRITDSTNPNNSSSITTNCSSDNTSVSSTNQNNINSKPWIRQWGCNLTLAPFIFVHIGKAGGGNVRARISASARNYTKERWARTDGSYYPFPSSMTQHGSTTERRAKFCNSGYPHHAPVFSRAYEGVVVCNATTPIGHMIGCPLRWPQTGWTQEPCYCDPTSTICDIVYVGHNGLGSELHWLPGPFLESWWEAINKNYQRSAITGTFSNNLIDCVRDNATDTGKSTATFLDGVIAATSGKTSRKTAAASKIASELKMISEGSIQAYPGKCYVQQNGKRRVIPNRKDSELNIIVSECSKSFIQKGDTVGRKWLSHQKRHQQLQHFLSPVESILQNDPSSSSPSNNGEDWSYIYASLPVARATVIRDPFTWLVSKFFWHSKPRKRDPHILCDNIEAGTVGGGSLPRLLTKIDDSLYGWISRYALSYIFFLCGEDCKSRFHLGTITCLEELGIQAERNLQTAFVVVGLLNETDRFYDMVSKRMSYIDTSLNRHVQGKTHQSQISNESLRCKEKFTTDDEFRQRLLKKSPEVRILKRLYDVGVEVNRFQLQELEHCSSN